MPDHRDILTAVGTLLKRLIPSSTTTTQRSPQTSSHQIVPQQIPRPLTVLVTSNVAGILLLLNADMEERTIQDRVSIPAGTMNQPFIFTYKDPTEEATFLFEPTGFQCQPEPQTEKFDAVAPPNSVSVFNCSITQSFPRLSPNVDQQLNIELPRGRRIRPRQSLEGTVLIDTLGDTRDVSLDLSTIIRSRKFDISIEVIRIDRDTGASQTLLFEQPLEVASRTREPTVDSPGFHFVDPMVVGSYSYNFILRNRSRHSFYVTSYSFVAEFMDDGPATRRH